MPCTPIVESIPPSLPSPFSVTPPSLPPAPSTPGVCCLKSPFSSPPLPLPPLAPGLLTPAILSAMNQAESIVETFLDQFAGAIPCPGE